VNLLIVVGLLGSCTGNGDCGRARWLSDGWLFEDQWVDRQYRDPPNPEGTGFRDRTPLGNPVSVFMDVLAADWELLSTKVFACAGQPH